ncbi:hypothetical protein GOAMI_01_02480 [Gordonia amicalis NBRC 100051 = JCM 11271]|nr:hypothetical protein GOAMI_01_02480 [Gordonia amicalis NBRC 100051 = JCM 11271]
MPVQTMRNYPTEVQMPRNAGDRYECQDCGARLVYEKECPCPEGMEHREICCGKQMTPVKD